MRLQLKKEIARDIGDHDGVWRRKWSIIRAGESIGTLFKDLGIISLYNRRFGIRSADVRWIHSHFFAPWCFLAHQLSFFLYHGITIISHGTLTVFSINYKFIADVLVSCIFFKCATYYWIWYGNLINIRS